MSSKYDRHPPAYFVTLADGERIAFVAMPGTKPTLYARTHPCVMLASCPSCGAFAGELCKTPYGKHTPSHHGERARNAQVSVRRPEKLEGQVLVAGDYTFIEFDKLKGA